MNLSDFSKMVKLYFGGCQYTYFDGSVCGKSTNKYASLCDSHFKQLNDTYQSFAGKNKKAIIQSLFLLPPRLVPPGKALL
jgi:hypothetical protein